MSAVVAIKKTPKSARGYMAGVVVSKRINHYETFYHPDYYRRHLNFTGSAGSIPGRGLSPPVEEFRLAPKIYF
jgi:hypothetical protein